MVNAQRVVLKENSHFLQDRPHGPVYSLKIHQLCIFKEENGGTKIFPGTWSEHLVGTPGRDTWWGHLRPAWVPPAPAACPPVYPPHKPGTHHTHSLTQSYIHTERHHKNPKDKSFGKKIIGSLVKPQRLDEISHLVQKAACSIRILTAFSAILVACALFSSYILYYIIIYTSIY